MLYPLLMEVQKNQDILQHICWHVYTQAAQFLLGFFGRFKIIRIFANKTKTKTIQKVMETSAKLYTLNFDEVKTYLWAALFVASGVVLPQVFHLIPQGGIVFAPLSLIILIGAYKFGWKTGLLAAVTTPLVNHLLFGMPEWGVLQVMMTKLVVLALVAGLVAQHYRRATLPILLGVVIASEVLGAVAELILTGGISATVQDITIGWPGLLLQVLGTYLFINWLAKK